MLSLPSRLASHCVRRLLSFQGVRKVDAGEKAALKVAASYMRRGGNRPYAKEIYVKIGDINSLMEV